MAGTRAASDGEVCGQARIQRSIPLGAGLSDHRGMVHYQDRLPNGSQQWPSGCRRFGKQPADLGILVGVAGFEPAASSSRSQVHRSQSRPYLWVVLLRLSMVVRGSPCKDVAIVTQLVTRGGWGDHQVRALIREETVLQTITAQSSTL